MKKSDLKSGMLVEYRNGGLRLVINESLINDMYCDFGQLRNDLTNRLNSCTDIVRVSNVLDGGDLLPRNWSSEIITNNLLWERKEEIIVELDGVEYSESTLRSLIKKRPYNFEIKNN